VKRAGALSALTGVCVALLIASASVASANRLVGEAQGDSLTLRGEVRSGGSLARESNGPATGSTLLQSCVPLDEGRLRCYSADPAVDGILAVSVEAGAAPVTLAEVAEAVATEFRRIPLSPPGIVVQPARGWTFVNIETVVLTRAAEQTFPITVLGIPVTVRATPLRYVWSFGDGTAPLVTTEPGAPWPNPSNTHIYRVTGLRTITLTTEWSGEYQIAGATSWQPIDGTATTTESAPPLEVRSATNALTTNS
jgi:hypothetical protein